MKDADTPGVSILYMSGTDVEDAPDAGDVKGAHESLAEKSNPPAYARRRNRMRTSWRTCRLPERERISNQLPVWREGFCGARPIGRVGDLRPWDDTARIINLP